MDGRFVEAVGVRGAFACNLGDDEHSQYELGQRDQAQNRHDGAAAAKVPEHLLAPAAKKGVLHLGVGEQHGPAVPPALILALARDGHAGRDKKKLVGI